MNCYIWLVHTNFKLNDCNYYKHFISLRGDYLDYHKVTANECVNSKPDNRVSICLRVSAVNRSINWQPYQTALWGQICHNLDLLHIESLVVTLSLHSLFEKYIWQTLRVYSPITFHFLMRKLLPRRSISFVLWTCTSVVNNPQLLRPEDLLFYPTKWQGR